jgi:hypothetical protein
MKRIPNIFAYIETQTRDLTVPSIGKERVSTVAKPQFKVAVLGGFPLELSFSEHVAEVRVSPKFFKILRIEFTSS